MSKITPISYKLLSRIFELDGFQFKRESGSHLVYIKKDVSRPVIIPKYKIVPIFIIKNNLRTAKISRERYFDLLKKAK